MSVNRSVSQSVGKVERNLFYHARTGIATLRMSVNRSVSQGVGKVERNLFYHARSDFATLLIQKLANVKFLGTPSGEGSSDGV